MLGDAYRKQLHHRLASMLGVPKNRMLVRTPLSGLVPCGLDVVLAWPIGSIRADRIEGVASYLAREILMKNLWYAEMRSGTIAKHSRTRPGIFLVVHRKADVS